MDPNIGTDKYCLKCTSCIITTKGLRFKKQLNVSMGGAKCTN